MLGDELDAIKVQLCTATVFCALRWRDGGRGGGQGSLLGKGWGWDTRLDGPERLMLGQINLFKKGCSQTPDVKLE